MTFFSRQNFRIFLVAALILGAAILSLAPQESFAADTTISDYVTSGCGFNILSLDCLLKTISYVTYYIFVAVAWFVGIAGNILNFALGITINNAFYAGGSITAVTAGWTFTRDIVNIFFIFALLFIAIATILGIESYGAKKLLSTLIIVALLVNFSLLATQAIIFVTNALAYELYSAVTVTGSKSYLLNSSQKGFDKDITGALMQSLGQQKILNSNPSNLNVGVNAASPTDPKNVGIAVFVTLIAGIFIMIFAGFIFLAAAFFFAARMAFLWILMILAPFGFVFLILPATKGYAQKWWSALQSQATFAPAFMFFILITIRVAQSDLINIVKTPSSDTSTTELLFLLIMQNLMIFLMLGGGLIVAKTLGIYGADGAMKMAVSGGNWFKGYAGKIGKRTTLSATAPAAGAIARSPLGRIPFVGKGAASVAAAGRKSIEEYEKEIEKYRPAELKNMLGSRFLQPTQSAAIMQKLIKEGDVGGIPTGRLRSIHNQMQRLSISTTDFERLRPDLAVPKKEDIEKYGEKEAKVLAMRAAASKQRSSDIEKMGPDFAEIKDEYGTPVMRAVAEGAPPGNIRAFTNKGGLLLDALVEQYKAMANGSSDLEEIANALVKVKNHAAAQWMRTSPAALLLPGLTRSEPRAIAHDELDDEEVETSQARREARAAKPATPDGTVLAPPGTGYGRPKEKFNNETGKWEKPE